MKHIPNPGAALGHPAASSQPTPAVETAGGFFPREANHG